METLRVPIPMIDDTSHASSVFGGIVAYWTEEAASITESQASFGRVVLDAKKLTAFASVPNELLADATAFGAFFDSIFPRALAWYEDIAFLAGTGVGEPLGLISCPASGQRHRRVRPGQHHDRVGEPAQGLLPDAADVAG